MHINHNNLENKIKDSELEERAKSKRKKSKEGVKALYQKITESNTIVPKHKSVNLKKLKKTKINKQQKKRRKINVNFLTMMLNNETRDFSNQTHKIDNWKQLLESQLLTIIDHQNIDHENILKSIILEIEDGTEDIHKLSNYETTDFDVGLYYFNRSEGAFFGNNFIKKDTQFRDTKRNVKETKGGFNDRKDVSYFMF